MTKQPRLLLILLAIAILIMPTKPALAYLDPGTGSYIFQLVIGAGLAGVYVLKNSWKNLGSWTRNLFSKRKGNDGEK